MIPTVKSDPRVEGYDLPNTRAVGEVVEGEMLVGKLSEQREPVQLGLEKDRCSTSDGTHSSMTSDGSIEMNHQLVLSSDATTKTDQIDFDHSTDSGHS